MRLIDLPGLGLGGAAAGTVGRTPVIIITVDGRPVSGTFYSLLVSATLTDNEGDEVDKLTLVLDDAGNRIERPRKGAGITCRIGYLETGIVDKGLFKVENVKEEGSVDRGEFLTIEANAADLRKDAKGSGQKAHAEKSFGDIVREEAREMGFEAVIAPSLASHMIDFRVRWNASRMDFVTRLAEEIGGIVKPAGGKLIVQERGSGKTASGKEMPPLLIDRSHCSEWSGNPVGRMEYGQVISLWTDPKTGEQRRVKVETGRQGPEFTVRDTFTDEKAARKAAEAQAGKLNRASGEASFTIYGNPHALAGQRVIASSFSPTLSGEWTSTTSQHTFKAEGYTTEVSVKAPETGRKETSK